MNTKNICKSLLISVFAIIFLRFSVIAQTDTLTNSSVLDLYQNGFSKTFIIDKINSSFCIFELSTGKLIELKKANIPEDIINKMMKKVNNSNAVAKEITTVKIASTNNLNTAKYSPPLNLSSGIYYQNKVTNELVELDPSVYSQAKSGSGILTSLTYGLAKTKSKASLNGTKANLQITSDTSPVFYFYFDKNRKNDLGENINTGGWFATVTTPNEFTLVKFEVPKKGNSREVVTGSYNIEGGSSGVAEEQNFGYKYEKISPGIYKVYFPNGISAGEYGFMYAGTSTANKVYDFGISK